MYDATAGAFDALLRDKMAELEQEAAEEAGEPVVEDDRVARLGLQAQQTILAVDGGPLPRAGHQAYVTPPVPPVEPGNQHLNLLR